eukprot:scaffold128666_cov35-Tisochrysis_lutea.AAC.2
MKKIHNGVESSRRPSGPRLGCVITRRLKLAFRRAIPRLRPGHVMFVACVVRRRCAVVCLLFASAADMYALPYSACPPDEDVGMKY